MTVLTKSYSMRPTKYFMVVILCSCLMTVSLSIPADFRIIHRTNDTITVQCLLYAPPDQRFINEVPLLQTRGTLPFEFTKIQDVLGDRYEGSQFRDEERVQLWGTFMIRNVANYDSDIVQKNFFCYQWISGKNVTVGSSLGTLTRDTNHPSSTSKYASDSPNPYSDLILCTISSIFSGVSTLVVAMLTLGEKIMKSITNLCRNIFRKPKVLKQPAETTSPAALAPSGENLCAIIDMECGDPKESWTSRSTSEV